MFLESSAIRQERQRNNRQQWGAVIRTTVGQSLGIGSTKKAMSRGQREDRCNSLAWRHMLVWVWGLITIPRWVRAGKLEQERASRTNMKSQVGRVKERPCKDMRNEKEPDWKRLQTEQFKSVMGEVGLGGWLTNLRRNSMLLLRTLLSDHVSNYGGRYIQCCGEASRQLVFLRLHRESNRLWSDLPAGRRWKGNRVRWIT